MSPGAKVARDFFVRELDKYGVTLSADVSYTFDLARQQQQATGMISRRRSAGVTTLAFVGDPLYPIFLTQEATRQNYFPEWLITGTLVTDTTFFGRTYDQLQWRHAFGISPLWVSTRTSRPRTPIASTATRRRAPRRVTGAIGIGPVRDNVQQIFVGIHMAGPNLTPDSFARGMVDYPAVGSYPAAPLLDYTEADPHAFRDFTEIWWDADATGKDEADNEGVGILMKADGGRRFMAGQWPNTGTEAFDPEGAIYTRRPGGRPTLVPRRTGRAPPPARAALPVLPLARRRPVGERGPERLAERATGRPSPPAPAPIRRGVSHPIRLRRRARSFRCRPSAPDMAPPCSPGSSLRPPPGPPGLARRLVPRCAGSRGSR